MRSSFFYLALGLLLAVGGADPARALTALPRNLDQLVARADAIFRGAAVSKEAAWKGEGANRHIVTRVTFQVAETYKGAALPQQTLEFFGGELDGKGMAVPDLPTFSVGDDAILFVEGNEKQFCPLVGAAQGHFRVVRARDSAVERVFTHGGGGILSAASVGQALPQTGAVARMAAAGSMTAALFRSEILQRVDRQNRGLLRVQD